MTQRVSERAFELLLTEPRSGEVTHPIFVLPSMLAVSSAPFAGGGLVARAAARALGVPAFGAQVIERVARTDWLEETIRTLDERAMACIEGYLITLFEERGQTPDAVTQRFVSAIGSIWGHGSCVMSHPSAVHLVPRTHALTVRVEAPRSHRAQRLQQREGISLRDAGREVDRADREHARFLAEHLGVRELDRESFDLVINTKRAGVEVAVKLIMGAYRAKFGRLRPTQDESGVHRKRPPFLKSEPPPPE